MSNTNNSVPFSPISRRVIIYMVLCSSLITLLLTAFQLYRDYQSDISFHQAQLIEIEKVHLKSVSTSLWAADTEKLKTIIEGIAHLKDVKYVAVIESNKIIAEVGTNLVADSLSQNYPIRYSHRRKIQELGQLTVTIDLLPAYQRVLDRAIVILISNAIKTTLVVVFMLIIIHQIVGQHLTKIARYFDSIQIDRPLKRLKLDRKNGANSTKDEFDLMVGAINDTSKRVTTAFAQIHNAEERTRDFAAASSDWFWEMDANLRYTYLSDRYEDISGNKIEDRVGTQRWEVFTSNDSTERWNDHKADLDARRPFRNFEYILTSGNGKKIFVSASGIPLFDEAGTFIGYRGSTSNITERKIAEIELREARDELEIRVHERTKQLQSEIEERKRIETHLIDVNIQAEAANRAKTEFLANMSHELRTPLNAIIGFSETLKQNIFGALANEKQEEYVVDIYNSGQHLLGLINDILDVSAIEAGKIHLHETEIDLKKVADDAIIMANPRAEIGKIELVNFVKDEGVRLLADERRIKQILVNLLINSVKYTLEKGTVEIHGGLEDNGTFFYEIIDPGIGMDEQGLKSAMEKFGQIHTTLGISNEGTGLGLPVSNGLIKAHGGTLHLESEPGVGTTVRIEFPKDRIVQLNDSIKANTGG